MFCRHKSFVHFCSSLGTFEYSHDLQAKMAAPMVSCTIDLSVSVTWDFANSSMTENGRAFCCFSVGSSFLKARNCRNNRMLSSLSESFVGFCLPDANDRKVCTTFDNHPLLTVRAKAQSKMICSCWLRLFMKMSWHPTRGSVLPIWPLSWVFNWDTDVLAFLKEETSTKMMYWFDKRIMS